MFDISVTEDLDDLRMSLEGCRMVAFADLSTRMVLRVSADPKPNRETVDALCNTAAQCLDSPGLTAFFDGETPYTAQVTDGGETTFFIRSLSDPADALILVVTEPMAQARVWAAAQAFLDGQGSGAPS